tara:strand:- start:5013 stop:7139 length:2127 start_codon:yes stop_codon:yes gene_type:complete
MSFRFRNQRAIPIILASMIVVLLPLQESTNNLGENVTVTHNSDSEGNLPIWGQSFLNFTDSISPSSQVNATWFAEITVSESYGTDLLENRSMGLLGQIDSHLGNSDGWINSTESQEFSDLFASLRDWTDSASGGCCSFDYNPMVVIGQVEIVVQPPETGPVNRTNGNWTWTESATISGTSDGRTLRLIDIPRAGAMVEEVPLEVKLPDDWEYRYSPMSEVISGSPGLFTVNRSQAPVASDIRITITENIPPIIAASRSPLTSSTIPLERVTSFSASCNDSPLDSPEIQWTVSLEGEVISTHNNPWFEVVPVDIGFSHGQVMSVNATCLDFHGESSNWNDNPTIDGMMPTWVGTMSVGDSENSPLEPTRLSPILAPAGTTIRFDVNGSDDSALPVLMELYSNISEGWRQWGMSEQTFEFTVNQGMGVNGAHMGIHQRHQARDPTMISVALLVSDDAGNTAIGQWTIQVVDANAPTVIPRLFSNGIEIEMDDDPHEDDELMLNLSHSFDDLDAIVNLSWSIWIDGDEVSWDQQNWSVSDSIPIPQLAQGNHEIVVKATDSNGNTREEAILLTVQPRTGAHIRVVEATLSEDSKVGGTATLTVIAENDGSDSAFARVCLREICGRWTEQPFVSSLENGPGQGVVEFQFEMENESLDGLYLNWDSASAGTHGMIPLEVEYNAESDNRGPTILVLAIGILSVLIMIYKSRGEV